MSSSDPQDKEDKKTWWQEWKQKLDDFYLKVPSTEIVLNGVEIVGIVLIFCFLLWFVLMQRDNGEAEQVQSFTTPLYPGYAPPVQYAPGYAPPVQYAPGYATPQPYPAAVYPRKTGRRGGRRKQK